MKELTNYIHMIGTSHLHYYLTKYCVLCKILAAGLGGTESKAKEVIFGNTSQGGCGGNNKGNGSTILGEHSLLATNEIMPEVHNVEVGVGRHLLAWQCLQQRPH